MAIHYLKECPECHNINSHEYWDAHTMRQMEIKPPPKGYMLSSSADPDEHAKFKTEYNCPICNAIVKGSNLVDKGVAEV